MGSSPCESDRELYVQPISDQFVVPIVPSIPFDLAKEMEEL
jgi:hypothetical protein